MLSIAYSQFYLLAFLHRSLVVSIHRTATLITFSSLICRIAVKLPPSTNSTLKPWSSSSPKAPTEIYTSTAKPSPDSALAGSLGTSTQIAIGVVIPVVVVALVLNGGWYLVFRKRRRPTTDVNIEGGMAPRAPLPFVQEKAGSGVNEIYELEAERKRSVRNSWRGSQAASDTREIFELPAEAYTSGSFVAICERKSGV